MKIVEAYELVQTLQTVSENDDDDDNDNANIRSTWVNEALGWIDTFEKVTEITTNTNLLALKDVTFARFTKSCTKVVDDTSFVQDDDSRIRIKLTDSTRDRKVILSQVFRSLISDVFGKKIIFQFLLKWSTYSRSSESFPSDKHNFPKARHHK